MSATFSSSRMCPVCDAPNSSISLFCAECGASLNIPGEGDTINLDAPRVTATEPSSQQTAALPAPARSPEPSPAVDSPRSVVWSPSGADSPVGDTAVAEPVATPSFILDRGMRGFYLGLVAVLLIAAVFFAWGWASILNDSARDSIRGLFDFIG